MLCKKKLLKTNYICNVFFLRVNLDVNVCWCSRIWSWYQAWADSETPPSVAVRAERILGDRVALVLAVAGWQSFCWWRREGTQPSTGPLQPSAPPEGSPGTSCPGISASGRSAQPSGAEPAGFVWAAAKGKRLRCQWPVHCGTGLWDYTITPPHLETHLFTFCHFLTGNSCVDRKSPIKDTHLTNLHQ